MCIVLMILFVLGLLMCRLFVSISIKNDKSFSIEILYYLVNQYIIWAKKFNEHTSLDSFTSNNNLSWQMGEVLILVLKLSLSDLFSYLALPFKFPLVIHLKSTDNLAHSLVYLATKPFNIQIRLVILSIWLNYANLEKLQREFSRNEKFSAIGNIFF